MAGCNLPGAKSNGPVVKVRSARSPVDAAVPARWASARPLVSSASAMIFAVPPSSWAAPVRRRGPTTDGLPSWASVVRNVTAPFAGSAPFAAIRVSARERRSGVPSCANRSSSFADIRANESLGGAPSPARRSNGASPFAIRQRTGPANAIAPISSRSAESAPSPASFTVVPARPISNETGAPSASLSARMSARRTRSRRAAISAMPAMVSPVPSMRPAASKCTPAMPRPASSPSNAPASNVILVCSTMPSSEGAAASVGRSPGAVPSACSARRTPSTAGGARPNRPHSIDSAGMSALAFIAMRRRVRGPSVSTAALMRVSPFGAANAIARRAPAGAHVPSARISASPVGPSNSIRASLSASAPMGGIAKPPLLLASRVSGNPTTASPPGRMSTVARSPSISTRRARPARRPSGEKPTVMLFAATAPSGPIRRSARRSVSSVTVCTANRASMSRSRSHELSPASTSAVRCHATAPTAAASTASPVIPATARRFIRAARSPRAAPGLDGRRPGRAKRPSHHKNGIAYGRIRPKLAAQRTPRRRTRPHRCRADRLADPRRSRRRRDQDRASRRRRPGAPHVGRGLRLLLFQPQQALHRHRFEGATRQGHLLQAGGQRRRLPRQFRARRARAAGIRL